MPINFAPHNSRLLKVSKMAKTHSFQGMSGAVVVLQV